MHYKIRILIIIYWYFLTFTEAFINLNSLICYIFDDEKSYILRFAGYFFFRL